MSKLASLDKIEKIFFRNKESAAFFSDVGTGTHRRFESEFALIFFNYYCIRIIENKSGETNGEQET